MDRTAIDTFITHYYCDKNRSEVCDDECDECRQAFTNSLNKIIDEQVEKALNNAWIPCSDRLPDTDGEYLCTTKAGAVNTYYFITDVSTIINDTMIVQYNDSYSYMFYISEDFGVINVTDLITAWMPKPKPYTMNE